MLDGSIEIDMVRTDTSGNAELFGVELAPQQTYTFPPGNNGAIFSWQGCSLEITGNAESEYAGQETGYATEWLNAHGMLASVRDQTRDEGPRCDLPQLLFADPCCKKDTSY